MPDMKRCIALEPPTQPYCGLLLAGEAAGETEEASGRCFVGRAGKVFDEVLALAGIVRAACVVTNVFHLRPPDNKVMEFFTDTTTEAWPAAINYPLRGKYLRVEIGGEIIRLREEADQWRPKMIVTFGAVPLWAFTGSDQITAEHGQLRALPHLNTQLMPVFHPSYLMRSGNLIHKQMVVRALEVAKGVCS